MTLRVRWTTQRLLIEPLTELHASELFAVLDDPRVAGLMGVSDVDDLDGLVRRIRRVTAGPPPERPHERWWNMAVRLVAPPGPIVGRVEATTYGDWGEIAYVFGPAHWGHGFATEATAWLVGHLEGELGVPELWACIAPTNGPSLRLAERLGFERVDAPRPGLGSWDEGDVVLRRLT